MPNLTTLPAVLYHGTKAGRAAKILQGGFKLGKQASYTGIAVNLSETVSLSHEYGTPEEGGVMLAITLKPETKWANFKEVGVRDGFTCYDAYFKQTGLDALRTWSGNVWLLWNPAMVASINRIPARQARSLLISEFINDGIECGYNGRAGNYCEVFWGSVKKLDGYYARLARELDAAGAGLQAHWEKHGIRNDFTIAALKILQHAAPTAKPLA